MPSIFLQEPFDADEIDQLRSEFRQYQFTSTLEHEQWHAMEIFYGSELKEEQLKKASHLKWIHTPGADLEGLCLDAIKEREILLTLSKGKNVAQMTEFVLGAILSFAKQFFHWKQAPHDPEEFWDWPLKQTMWTLHNKTLLQIGLGEVGTEVTRIASSMGLKCWGVRKKRSFHPYCHKTFGFDAINSLLPTSDIVVIALPKIPTEKPFFSHEELELMKPDSILIVLGSGNSLDEKALCDVGKSGKFRGILLDTFRHPPPAKNSKLWDIPNIILTPSIGGHPESEEHLAFHLFRKNLRAFIPGNLGIMKNLAIN